MVAHAFLGLLNRRGEWMTPVEIFDDSPDYPVGDYVLADLHVLKSHGLVVTRLRSGSNLTEYGLPGWVNAPEPALTIRYLVYSLNRLLAQAASLVRGG